MEDGNIDMICERVKRKSLGYKNILFYLEK